MGFMDFCTPAISLLAFSVAVFAYFESRRARRVSRNVGIAAELSDLGAEISSLALSAANDLHMYWKGDFRDEGSFPPEGHLAHDGQARLTLELRILVMRMQFEGEVAAHTHIDDFDARSLTFLRRARSRLPNHAPIVRRAEAANKLLSGAVMFLYLALVQKHDTTVNLFAEADREIFSTEHKEGILRDFPESRDWLREMAGEEQSSQAAQGYSRMANFARRYFDRISILWLEITEEIVVAADKP